MDLAVRDIRRNPRRFMMTCAGVGLLMLVVMGMSGIYRGIIDDATSLLNATDADVWVVQEGTNGPFAEDSRLPEDLKKTLRGMSGVVASGALSFQTFQTQWKEKPLRLFAVGYDQALELGGPVNIIEGRPIRRSHYEMLAGVRSGLSAGDVITLGNDGYTVVGIVSDNVVSPGGDPVVYLTLPDAQELLFKKDNAAIRNDRARAGEKAPGADTHIVNAVVLRLADGRPMERVIDDISRWKHLRAMSAADQEKILTGGMVEKSKMQLWLFRTILIIVSMAVIALVIYTQTMEKTREIATLKLIGSPDSVIVRLILEQALLMGFAAYWIGFVLFQLTYSKFPKRMIANPFDLQALFAVVMVICVIASISGIRSALRVDPARALGG
ncbi:MAG: ABC transporter permease [Nitrospirae bacterium]|nr:ABC transporter permease [Nitrospirota bacterium]